jgi:hypothetical protein
MNAYYHRSELDQLKEEVAYFFIALVQTTRTISGKEDKGRH